MVPITRADRAYCRKWTAAHRKGKPTAEITREWLGKLRAPTGLAFAGVSDACVVTLAGYPAMSELSSPAGAHISFTPVFDDGPLSTRYYEFKQG
jgi:hypothetical protein